MDDLSYAEFRFAGHEPSLVLAGRIPATQEDPYGLLQLAADGLKFVFK